MPRPFLPIFPRFFFRERKGLGTRLRLAIYTLTTELHPNAPSNCSGSISAAYKKHEDIKKRAYGQRVREIEHGVFTPLVFSTTGGMGREAITFYKRLADKLAWKQQKPYSVVMSWLRCKLSFAAIRSSIMCIRGSRSSTHRPVRDADITLATSEGFVPLQD